MCDDEVVLDLAEDSTHEAKLGFRAPIRLTLVEGLLVNLILQLWWDGGSGQDAILAPGQVGFEAELADGEGENEWFPRDVWVVEEAREAVEVIHCDVVVSRMS